MDNLKKRKIIFFDIDDTLFCTSDFARDNRNRCFYKLIELGIGCSFEDISNRFYEIEHEYGPNFNGHFNVLVGEMNFDDSRHDYLIANVVTSYHLYKNKINNYKFLGVDFILSKLKEKGFEVGIITHGIGIKQIDKLIRLDILKYFNQRDIFVTGTLGFNQKYIEFYENIYEKYFENFSDIFMVGDNEKSDIIPACDAGFKTIRVGSGDIGSIDFDKSSADYKIKSISDLLEIEIFD